MEAALSTNVIYARRRCLPMMEIGVNMSVNVNHPVLTSSLLLWDMVTKFGTYVKWGSDDPVVGYIALAISHGYMSTNKPSQNAPWLARRGMGRLFVPKPVQHSTVASVVLGIVRCYIGPQISSLRYLLVPHFNTVRLEQSELPFADGKSLPEPMLT